MKKWRVKWIVNSESFQHEEKSFYDCIEWLEANKERFHFLHPESVEVLEYYNNKWYHRYSY